MPKYGWPKRGHRHVWRRQHPPLFGHSGGGYFDCATCPERKVSEPDAYSYVGWPWVHHGTLPPETRWDAVRDAPGGSRSAEA